MQGNLQQIQLPEVLQFISMGKSSGLLTIKDTQGLETTLMIRKGRIINSSALDRQRRLGELLIHRGILKRSVLTQLLALQRTIESDKRLGEILIERDIVQETTLREVLRLQLEEEIWNLFGLESGEFRFEQVDDTRLGTAAVQIDIEPLLLEGTRRQDEWRKILKLLPSDRLILGINNADNFTGGDREKLSPSEWKVIAQINGHLSIRGVVNRSGMGRFEVYRIVYDFIRRGLIYVKDVATLAAEEDAIAAAVESERESSPQGARTMGGFFSRLTSAGRKDDRSGELRFITPVGSVSHFINRVLDQIFTYREVRNSPDSKNIIIEVWEDLLINFTKADLIHIQRARIMPDELETYFRLFQFSDAVQDCYEDSVEALLQMLDSLYRIFAAKIGEKAMNKIVREILDEMAPRAKHEYVTDFNLSERILGVLRVAA